MVCGGGAGGGGGGGGGGLYLAHCQVALAFASSFSPTYQLPLLGATLKFINKCRKNVSMQWLVRFTDTTRGCLVMGWVGRC